MNQNIKNVILFLSGAAGGASVMYFTMKKYFELKADLEIESVKKAYEEMAEEFEEKSSEDGELVGPKEINEDEQDGERVKAQSPIAEKFNNKPPLKDYAKMFKETKEGESDLKVREIVRSEDLDPAVLEGPEDDEPYTDEEDEDTQMDYEDYRLNGEHRKALKEGRNPYVIEASDFELTCDNYEKIDLMYYIHEDILADDSGEEINRFDVIGETLSESGFDNDDVDVMFVRNDKLMCDYMVTKLYVQYEK